MVFVFVFVDVFMMCVNVWIQDTYTHIHTYNLYIIIHTYLLSIYTRASRHWWVKATETVPWSMTVASLRLESVLGERRPSWGSKNTCVGCVWGGGLHGNRTGGCIKGCYCLVGPSAD